MIAFARIVMYHGGMIPQFVIPAIIPESYDYLQSRLRDLRRTVHRVQVDVMDGTYTRAASWPYTGADRAAFEAIRREDEGLPYWQDFDFEIDLMVREPEKHIAEWSLAGAACVIIHAESTDHMDDVIAAANERRLEVALALKPSTDIERIAPFVHEVQFVQCMGSDSIGTHGVALEDRAIAQVRALRARWPDIAIGVDIGVSAQTIPTLLDAGATRFAAGSAIFLAHDSRIAWKELERMVRDIHHAS